jgi:6-phosphogluconolactonase
MSIAALSLQSCGGGSHSAPASLGSMPIAGPVTQATVASAPFQVGGSVLGLTGAGLVLELNGTQDVSIAADGSFVFPAGITAGNAYSVTVKTQPAVYREFCAGTNSSGTVAATISNVAFTCTNLAGFLHWGATGGSGASGSITGYGIQAGTGALLPLGQPTSIDNDSVQLLAAASGHFLYSFNLPPDGTGVALSTFAVDPSSGSLSLVGTVTTPSPVTAAGITPSGSYLFAGTEDGSVITFAAVAATGMLNSVGSVTLASPYAVNIDAIAVTPDGQQVYVLQTDGYGSSLAILNIFSVNANTGALTAVPTMTLNGLPVDFVVDPLGRFLYITTYSINASTGALSQMVPALTIAGNSASWAAEPSGRFLYVVSSYNLAASDDTIAVMSIDQNWGALTPLGAAQSIGSDPVGVVTDPSGEFVYVANKWAAAGQPSWSEVTGYSIGQDPATLGQLTQIGSGTQISSHQPMMGGPIAIIE